MSGYQLMKCPAVDAVKALGVCNEGILLEAQRISMLLSQAQKSCPAVERITQGRTAAAPFYLMQHQRIFHYY